MDTRLDITCFGALLIGGTLMVSGITEHY